MPKIHTKLNMENIKRIENLNFEDFRHQNGLTFWWASDLMKMLGYKEMNSFEKVIERTTKAMISLNIKHYENIKPVENPDTNKYDFKLSRFACYMTVMNAGSKHKEVAAAQAYFSLMTQKFEELIKSREDIDRLVIRDEIKEGNKSLNSIAKQSGLTNYANFANQGYLGLYNMFNWQLAKKRNIDKKKLFEHMGRAELSANLFRITMTEEKIKKDGIEGQIKLENTHYNVGRQVRNMVRENVGVNPENLPQNKRLQNVKKEIKQNIKAIDKIDKSKQR